MANITIFIHYWKGKTPLRYERGRNPDEEAPRDVDEFVAR
jgi:hypothetical protein